MKYLFTIILILSGLFTFSQDVDSKKQTIDLIVESIDQHKNYGVLGFRTRSIPQMSYICRVSYDKPIRIIRDFILKDDSVHQVFYTSGGQLIYAEEIITTFMKDADTIFARPWGGKYYFSDGKLIYHITHGHGKSEDEDWNPEKEVLGNYKTAIKEFSSRYKKKN